MLTFMETNLRNGAVAPRLVQSDGKTRPDHMRLPNLWTPLLFGSPLEKAFPRNFEVRRYFALDIDYDTDGDLELPSGACLLMRAKALKKDAAFDERMGVAFHQADLCRRLALAGWRIAYLEGAHVVHAGGSRRGRRRTTRPRTTATAWPTTGSTTASWPRGGSSCASASPWSSTRSSSSNRRAEGWPEEPLKPVWENFSGSCAPSAVRSRAAPPALRHAGVTRCPCFRVLV
jgi:GT2 family glycosyltransferase